MIWLKLRTSGFPEWMRSPAFKVAITTGLIVAIVGAVLTVFVFPGLRSLGDPGSIADQLRSIRADAARENLAAVVDRRVDLQRSGQAAYLLVFRHRSLRPFSHVAPADISDNIRIYSADKDGRLQLEFSFQPQPLEVPVSAETVKASRKAGVPVPPPVEITLTFQVATIKDLDGNDRPELLGAYFQRFMSDEQPIPIVVAWSDRNGGYRLYPLLTKAPRLRRLHAGAFGAAKRVEYRKPIVLHDTHSDFKTTAFAAEGFGIARTALGQPGLVTSFLGRSPSHAEPQSLELKSSVVSYEDAPRALECSAGRFPTSKPSVLVNVQSRPFTLLKYSGYFGEIARPLARRFFC